LEEAQKSAQGQLLQRSLDLISAIKLGVRVGLDEIAADEFYAMMTIQEEVDRLEKETSKK
jgi:hypothetical protein